MSRNFVIFIFQLTLLLFNLVRFFDIGKGIDKYSLLLSVIVSLFSSVIFFCFYEPEKQAKGQFLRISYLFIIGFLIVHFQIYIDYILGNTASFRRDYFLYAEIVNKTSVISSIGLNVFFIGYLSKCVNPKIEFKTLNNGKYKSALPILMILAVLCFTIFITTVDRQYFSGKYGEVEMNVIPTFAQTFLYYCIAAYLIVYSYDLKNNGTQLSFKRFFLGQHKVFLVVTFIYLILVLVSGDRGPIMQIGLLAIGAFSFSQNKKVTAKYFIMGIVLGSVAITVLGQIRSFKDGKSFFERYEQANSFSEKAENKASFSPNTHELAISVRTVHASVNYTEEFGYKYGLVQFNQLLAIIPGFGTLLREFTGLETKDLASADILTHYIFGNDPSHGLGTSCVADIYLDFGLMGILVGLFLFGVFVRFLEVSSFSTTLPSLFTWVVMFIFLSKALYIGRSSIMILFRECITIYVIILMSSLIMRKRNA